MTEKIQHKKNWWGNLRGKNNKLKKMVGKNLTF